MDHTRVRFTGMQIHDFTRHLHGSPGPPIAAMVIHGSTPGRS